MALAPIAWVAEEPVVYDAGEHRWHRAGCYAAPTTEVVELERGGRLEFHVAPTRCERCWPTVTIALGQDPG